MTRAVESPSRTSRAAAAIVRLTRRDAWMAPALGAFCHPNDVWNTDPTDVDLFDPEAFRSRSAR